MIYHVRIGGTFGERHYKIVAESIESAETQAVIAFNDENTGERIGYMAASLAGNDRV